MTSTESDEGTDKPECIRTQSNIYNGAFLRKQLTAESSMVDVLLGSKYASVDISSSMANTKNVLCSE